DPDDGGNLPIVAGQPSDDAAERAPVVEFARCPAQLDDERCLPSFLEVITVTRRPPSQSGAQRRWPALEIRTRAAHAVGIDHDPGIAVRDVLAEYRRHDRLVVDTGVCH